MRHTPCITIRTGLRDCDRQSFKLSTKRRTSVSGNAFLSIFCFCNLILYVLSHPINCYQGISPMLILSRSRIIQRSRLSNTNLACRMHSERVCFGTSQIYGNEEKMKSLNDKNKHFEEIFCYDLPEGRCLGVKVDEASLSKNESDCQWLDEYLHSDEIAYGLGMNWQNTGFNSFFLGRLAIRQAFRRSRKHQAIIDTVAILRDEYGRPSLPTGLSGSISHKKNIAVALVADSEYFDEYNALNGIGVDIEYISLSTRIGRRVLTPNERSKLGNLPGLSDDEETILRFSLKESIYKAIHPLISEYVGFQEAEVIPYANGTSDVNLLFGTDARSKIGCVTAHWRKVEGGNYFLTTAHARGI